MVARAGLLAFLLALVLAACGGSGDVPVPGIASATATRDQANGLPLTTSTVRVRFDRTLTLADSNLPLASLFELQVPDPAGDGTTLTRVLVKKAERVQGNSRSVDLHVDQLVPDGSKVRVAKRGFKKDDQGFIEADITSDLAALQAILGSRAMGIGDPSILDGTKQPAATAADRDSAAMRQLLDQHLQQRGASDDNRQRALARYDSIPQDIVPSPKLRAALAALTGTFAEPAIDSFLTADNCTKKPAAVIAFQQTDEPDIVAEVTFTDDNRRIVSFEPSVEGEPIEHLMPVLAHEAIHCDTNAGQLEEITATAFQSFLYLQIVATFPDTAHLGTPLTRELNFDAIALINSGRAVPETVGVLQSPGVNDVIPGVRTGAKSFADLIGGNYSSLPAQTPDEPVAQAYASRLATVAGVTATTSAFNLAYLDTVLGGAINPQVVLAAIDAFELAPTR